MADPRDLTSVPAGLGANDELHVPLTRPRASRGAPSWLRHLRNRHRLVTSFCTSDRHLLRWEADAGSAERFVARLAPSAAVTLDVPYYAFMTQAMKTRALARSLGAITCAVRHWDPVGVQTIPLVKGLGFADWEPQLRLARDAGLRRVALYAREQRLEGDDDSLRRFARAAADHRLRPLLLGCFSRPRATTPFDAAALHQYVLARRGRALDRAGRPHAVGPDTYSDLLGRFLSARRVGDLVLHNFLRARASFASPAPLSRFGFVMS